MHLTISFCLIVSFFLLLLLLLLFCLVFEVNVNKSLIVILMHTIPVGGIFVHHISMLLLEQKLPQLQMG